MDGRRRRFSASKESEHGVNYSRGRNGQKEKNRRYRRHQNGNRVIESRASDYPSTCKVQPVQQASTSSTTINNGTKVLDIPGYIYDPVKKRYFKEKEGLHKHFIVQNEIEKHDARRKASCKIPSRLQYLRKRETTVLYNNFRRRGLEDWARTIVERESFTLSDTHPCPAFKGSLSSLALSRYCGKLVTIAKLPGLGCNTIHIYDVNHDKKFICPRMLATIIASEVTHVEWNPHESMKNFFLLNLFGSENSKGSAVVCKFDECLQSCELNSYPLGSGTAWQCSWSRNPQYPSLLGIAGTKQAVLVDSEKKAMICKIRSSSDIFCIEFGQRRPVAYLGCRNGNIMCVDIRVRDEKQSKPFNVSGRVRSSATCIKVVEDENYLMASSIDGMIKMWDVRLSKPVKEFLGNVNETKLIPFVMDSSESILASAGHDGKTRLWSIRTCEMLKTIDETKTRNGDVSIPPVCLGENWALRDNMTAFGLGIEDKLKLYY